MRIRYSPRRCATFVAEARMKQVHTLLLRPEDADRVVEVFDEFSPDVWPPRCVSKLGVDRPGILVSIAMVAVACRSVGGRSVHGCATITR
jgi:hypothetical protein